MIRFFLFSIKIVEIKREKNSTLPTDLPLREQREEPRRLCNINESWRETRLWVGGWGPMGSGAPLRVAGLRCMLTRVHCVSKLAGPCCGVSYCHAHHQVEPLLLFGRHCAVDRDQHDHPSRACLQVRRPRCHPRHCSSAHHRRAHGGRAQHVAGRDPYPTDCREKFGPTQPVTGSNFNGHVHWNIWTGEYIAPASAVTRAVLPLDVVARAPAVYAAAAPVVVAPALAIYAAPAPVVTMLVATHPRIVEEMPPTTGWRFQVRTDATSSLATVESRPS